MEKFICIHGHFYQPPRENPWLESIEVQDSAAPYHDWNERVTAECYAPNATARIMDGEGRIAEITSNYSKISFNFGPTVLAWMRDKMPEIHQAIVSADELSRQRYSGHGSAIAQVYNHMILPLANERDKHTQVYWGIRDFEFRFGRKPEGMWLAETAADVASLDAMAQQGIKFTILSPYQASRAREMGKRNWRDVNGGQIDPSRPYLIKLPSGRSIVAFFYDGPVSQAVAFETLLGSGEKFASRLLSAFSDKRTWDQLVHIATDGESYGHHHRHGEMALAYALHYIENNNLAKLTNYGEFLEKHPPTHEAQIHEKSAWSCPHGVGRWMSDCGCNSGGHPGWRQGWRTPLRESLDWLRDAIAPLYESVGREFFKDPWQARNEYIAVLLDRSTENREKFLSAQSTRALTDTETVRALKLLEMQRHAMLMYTSCGWFFDELSGLETVQVAQYAARVLQLASEAFDKDFEKEFLEKFQAARSNIPEHKDGRRIYEKFVLPARIDWPKAAAHYAISSLFHQYAPSTRIFSFVFEDEHRQVLEAGKAKLAVGRAKILSVITGKSVSMTYAVLYLGEHNLTCGVREFDSQEAYDKMTKEITEAFGTADFPETIRMLDRHFKEAPFSLKSLFKDEQRRILNEILTTTREDLEQRFRLITERYTPLMKFLEGAQTPLPSALGAVADLVLQSDIRKLLETEPIDLDRLPGLLAEAQARAGRILDPQISFVAKNRMEQLMLQLAAEPEAIEKMRALERVAALLMPLPLGLNLWKVQNTYWEMMQKLLPDYHQKAEAGDEAASAWVHQFLSLGNQLGFAVEKAKTEVPEMKMAA